MAIMLITIIWPYVIEVYIHLNQTQVMMAQLLPQMVVIASVETQMAWICTVVGYGGWKATYHNNAQNCW